MRKLTVSLALAAATLGVATPAAASTGDPTLPSAPVPYVLRQVPNVKLDQDLVYSPVPYVSRQVPVVTLDPGLVINCLNPPPGVSKAEFLNQLLLAGPPSPPPVICP